MPVLFALDVVLHLNPDQRLALGLCANANLAAELEKERSMSDLLSAQVRSLTAERDRLRGCEFGVLETAKLENARLRAALKAAAVFLPDNGDFSIGKTIREALGE